MHLWLTKLRKIFENCFITSCGWHDRMLKLTTLVDIYESMNYYTATWVKWQSSLKWRYLKQKCTSSSRDK